jgi:hypothetical protein
MSDAGKIKAYLEGAFLRLDLTLTQAITGETAGSRSSRRRIRQTLTTIWAAFGGRAALIASFSSATVLRRASAIAVDALVRPKFAW